MDAPPPQYAEYPRARVESGSADRLKALADGYFGLNWVFLANIGAWILGFALVMVAGSLESGPLAILGMAFIYLGIPLGIGFLSYPKLKNIAYGASWSVSPIFLAVLMGINTLTCGIIGYIVIQSIAAGEIKKKFRMKSRFFGYRKKDIEARVAELRAQEVP